MDEYINKAGTLQKMWKALYKLEDMQEEQEEFDAILRFYVQKGFEVALKTVIDEPTIDIVHCMECKHYGTEDDYDMCKLTRILHDDDWFCADGERKTE